MIFLFAVCGLIILPFVCVDLYMMLNEWQARIHIGRWTVREEWRRAMERKAQQWLHRMPIVPRTDAQRWILWDMFRRKYGSRTIQSWQVAGLLFGLGQEATQQYVMQHPELLMDAHAEVDVALLAYVMKKYGVLTVEQEKCVGSMFEPYVEEGTIPYRKHLPMVRFVDTIGLVCPFLYAVGLKDLAERQIREYDEALFAKTFPAHAFHVERKKPMGLFDWSRGVGWYILGLTETSFKEQEMVSLAQQLLSLRLVNGGFSSMLFNSEERMESSGTALIGLLFVKAYEVSGEKLFLEAARQAEKALMQVTQRNGVVDYAQGDTAGIGHYSRHYGKMPFAQGMTLYLTKRIDEVVAAGRGTGGIDDERN